MFTQAFVLFELTMDKIIHYLEDPFFMSGAVIGVKPLRGTTFFEEHWDSKTHKFMTEGDLGLADFREMLELDGISQYIIGRVRKFDNYTSEIDRQYVVNNFTSV